MVNNFEYIKKHMSFLNEKSFYFIQILKRKKENPEMNSYSRPIESFYVFSVEQFERMMPHIIEKCEENRARAYIKMNCLDAESVMLEQIAEISREIRKKNWTAMPRTLNSSCGMCGKQDGVEKLYLIDLDGEYAENGKYQEIAAYINNELEPKALLLPPNFYMSKVKMVVPTKHGVHLLSTGFDKRTFSQKYPNIDVHDDGITLLYYPECCDE